MLWVTLASRRAGAGRWRSRRGGAVGRRRWRRGGRWPGAGDLVEEELVVTLELAAVPVELPRSGTRRHFTHRGDGGAGGGAGGGKGRGRVG